MNKEEIKIITLGDIFKNIETEEKAFKFLKYIKKLQQENQQLKENYDRIYNENCKLREKHNITDISLLDENQQLKKQKDDVVEYIKNNTYFEDNIVKTMVFGDFSKEILRMLGEIDDK